VSLGAIDGPDLAPTLGATARPGEPLGPEKSDENGWTIGRKTEKCTVRDRYIDKEDRRRDEIG